MNNSVIIVAGREKKEDFLVSTALSNYYLVCWGTDEIVCYLLCCVCVCV